MTTDIDPNTLLRSMVSIRGLADSGDRIPLRRFRGKLTAVAPRQVTYQGTATTRVDLKFNEVVVMESLEPWPYPTAELSIKLSNTKNSSWGIFSKSLAERIPADKDIYDTIGSEFEMMVIQHQFGFSKDTFIPSTDGSIDPATGEAKMVPAPIVADCWQVAGITGAGAIPASANGSAAMEAALALLDGHTEAEFNAEVWKDATVKADASLSSMLLARGFIPPLVAAGRVTVDPAGIYSVVRGNGSVTAGNA